MNFKENTHHLVSKISNKIGILHRLRQVLPQKALNQIYLTSIQPLFDYCITVWGPSSKTNVNTIQRLQNRCARAVTGDFSFETSVSYLIKSLGWMTIQERLHYSIKTWNKLPLYIRQSNNLMSFKKALKNTYNETISN